MLQNATEQDWSNSGWKRLAAFIMSSIVGNQWTKYELKMHTKFPTPNSLIPPFFPKILAQFFLKVPIETWKSCTSMMVFILALATKSNIALPYMLAYLLPMNTFFRANRGRFFSVIFYMFVGLPLMEIFAGSDCSNPTREDSKELNKKLSFRIITCLWVPMQYSLLFWACWVANPRASHRFRFTTSQLIGFMITIGTNTGGLGINIAHELIHKNNIIEKTLGKLLLVGCCYGHWYTEHIFGHHRTVSTPEDPATAHFNESFYRFWFRSVWGGLISSWNLERNRLAKLGYTSPWTPANSILQLHSASALLATTIATLFGRQALLLFFGQSVVAFSLLEIVNYIEHYGLMRKKQDNSCFEPVKVHHSWNADARITNCVLFKLQRHSDHHAHASRRYQILRSFPNAPQMPTGYTGMMTMALIPPVWFRIMNPRVKRFQTLEN